MSPLEPAAVTGRPQAVSSLRPPAALSLGAAWQLLVTSAGVPVIVIGGDGQVRFLNAVAHVAFQIPESVDPASTALETLLNPEAATALREELWKVTALRAPSSFSLSVRSRLFEISLNPLPPSEDDPLGLVVAIARCPAAASAMGPSESKSPCAMLSRRERQVLSMIGSGQRTEAMAAKLGVSTKTIHNYVAGVGRKLRVSTRLEMARIANQLGLPGE